MPAVTFEVAGHTDSTGSRAFNTRLSRERAAVVREYLIEHGVSAERVEARGYGSDQPVASNRTSAGRSRNRRSELRLLGPDTSSTSLQFTVELTGFGSRTAAEQLHSRLIGQGFDARLELGAAQPSLRIGRFRARRDADELAARFIARGLPATVIELPAR